MFLALGGLLLCAAAQQASAPPARGTAPAQPAAQAAPSQTSGPASVPSGAPPPAAAKSPGEASAAAAQSETGLSKFTVGTTEIELPVSVTDDQGKFISDLTRDDFRVLDEGRTQRVEFFSHTDKQPVVVGFLIDLSSASRTQWDKYKEAAKDLIWALLPDDPRFSGYLVTYTQEAVLAVDTTIYGDRLTERLEKVKPQGGSALYDAIYIACEKRKKAMNEPYEPRPVIIVIGDGHDNNSTKTLDEVLELAKRDQVTIFGLSTAAYEMDNEAEEVLEKLAKETGGRVEYPLSNPFKDISGYISTPMDAGNYQYEAGTGGYASAVAKSIINSVASLQGEITTQYVLRYRPDIDPESASKTYRHIKVEVPGLPNVRVRTKDGYYPFAPPPEAPKPSKPIGIAVPSAAVTPAAPPRTEDPASKPKPGNEAKPKSETPAAKPPGQ